MNQEAQNFVSRSISSLEDKDDQILLVQGAEIHVRKHHEQFSGLFQFEKSSNVEEMRIEDRI
ncbi:MAG: hypothetical protein MHPSP_004392, partial [Paramarteilia canceri]